MSYAMKLLREELAALQAEVARLTEALTLAYADNERLRGLLGKCYVTAGADTDGDPPERHANDAPRAVADMRNDYDDACEELHGTNGYAAKLREAVRDASLLAAALDGAFAALDMAPHAGIAPLVQKYAITGAAAP